MRGKAQFLNIHLQNYGITPAYAGKRAPFPQTAASAWDHPRLCGEKIAAFNRNRVFQGSPPPMRGKVKSIVTILLTIGITPAYAGKRQGSYFKVAVIEDHPRLCGEKHCHSQN